MFDDSVFFLPFVIIHTVDSVCMMAQDGNHRMTLQNPRNITDDMTLESLL